MTEKTETLRQSNAAAFHPECRPVPITELQPAAATLRRHGQAKRRSLLRSIAKNGLISPIIINASFGIVDGHARVDAARELGWRTVPAIKVEHLSDADLRLFAIAANKLPAEATWDLDALRLELESIELSVPKIDLTLSGFEIPAIDALRGAHLATQMNDLHDDLPVVPAPETAVSRLGDLWQLGVHRLICGDATDPAVLARLMGEETAEVLFTDPPYNVPIDGHVSGKGAVRHREFAMAVGEMSVPEFVAFLVRALAAGEAHLKDGALAYVCMDHGHLGELLEAGAQVFTERKAICIWDKGVGGMGSLYRNAFEAIAVFKKGKARHINNVSLGKHGRNRTTVWRYPGVSAFGKGRKKALSIHPTVKPVALVADALLDASERSGIVLDMFGGSGTTLIAAELVCRQARLVELDTAYVDAIISRFEALTKTPAIHIETSQTFAQMRAERIMLSASVQGEAA